MELVSSVFKRACLGGSEWGEDHCAQNKDGKFSRVIGDCLKNLNIRFSDSSFGIFYGKYPL
jgi:hypothetical protein